MLSSQLSAASCSPFSENISAFLITAVMRLSIQLLIVFVCLVFVCVLCLVSPTHVAQGEGEHKIVVCGGHWSWCLCVFGELARGGQVIVE